MNRWVLRRRPHISWLIAILCLAVLAGISLARYITPTIFSSWIWCSVSILLIFTILWRRYIYLVPLLIVGGLVLGVWRGSVQTNELADMKVLLNTTTTVTGHVREDVDSNSAGELVVRLDGLSIKGRLIHGILWATIPNNIEIKRGDTIMITGTVANGFGSFAASMYRARIGSVERPEPGDVARRVRDWFADSVQTAVPLPESSLGLGYLVGQKRALPTDLIEALQIVGLTHVVVASGYNLTILVRLARRLFEKVSKYLSALSSIIMIASFIAITGMSPSMSRAGLVAGMSLAAWYYGRRFHPLVLLSVAAAVTVLINPSYAWGDLGWELSFAAFAGVMILAPLLQRFFFGDKKPSIVRQILGETTAAIIATAPILIQAFGQFSNVAIIANLLVLPFVPLAMLLTFIAGIGTLIMPMFATIIGLPASWLLHYMISVVHYFAGIPWAVSTLQLPVLGVAICYGVLISICIWLQRVTRFDLTMTNLVE